MSVLQKINASLDKAFWISALNVFCGLTTIIDSVTFVSAKVAEEHVSPSIRPVISVEHVPVQPLAAQLVVNDSSAPGAGETDHCAISGGPRFDGAASTRSPGLTDRQGGDASVDSWEDARERPFHTEHGRGKTPTAASVAAAAVPS